MASGGAPAPARTSRLVEFLSGVPLVTLTVLAICIVVYVGDNLGDFNAAVSATALRPDLILFRLELWRIVTAAYTHLSLLHIAMNMMSLYSLGSSLEPLFGSLQYFFIMLVYTLAVGVLYVAASVVLALAVHPAYISAGAAGFSGVLFAMAVDECSLSPFPTRSLFGIVTVPTRLYPLALMLALQLVMPGVSWLGHLCGIAVGALHAVGALRWAVPSLTTLRALEASPRLARLVRSGPYKLVPPREVVRETGGWGVVGTWAAAAVAPLVACAARLCGGGAAAVDGGAGGATRRVDADGRVGATAPSAPPPAAAPQPPAAAAPAPPPPPAPSAWQGDVEAGGAPPAAPAPPAADRPTAALLAAAAAARRLAAKRGGASGAGGEGRRGAVGDGGATPPGARATAEALPDAAATDPACDDAGDGGASPPPPAVSGAGAVARTLARGVGRHDYERLDTQDGDAAR